MIIKVNEVNNCLDSLYYFPNNMLNRKEILYAIKSQNSKLDKDYLKHISNLMNISSHKGFNFIRKYKSSFKVINRIKYYDLLKKNKKQIIDKFNCYIKKGGINHEKSLNS